MFCRSCGIEVSVGHTFCTGCGTRLQGTETRQEAVKATDVTVEDYKLFIGENADTYLPKFALFNLGGSDNCKMTWHWPAFFVSFWWTIYRKLYIWTFLLFALCCIPYISFFAWVIWPIVANYAYYKHAKNKILEMKLMYPDRVTQQEMIKKAGGTNGTAVAVIIGIFVFCGILLASCINSMGH
jgi:hypothetical protein